MNKIYIIVLAAMSTVLLSCKKEEAKHEVKNHGALMNLMGGRLEAVVDLDTIPTTNLYALGAQEKLKGELQIWDGKAYHSRSISANEVELFDDPVKASLLVYAQVEQWNSPIKLSGFKTSADLESQIKSAAVELGINVNKPFPFLIQGTVDLLDWHVINWPEGDLKHTHKKHQESGSNGRMTEKSVKIIGFYSEKHKAVFTHHTTFLHMHVITDEIAGHVDQLQGTQLTLSLPKWSLQNTQ